MPYLIFLNNQFHLNHKLTGELHQPPGGCTMALDEIGSATLNLQAEQMYMCVLMGFYGGLTFAMHR